MFIESISLRNNQNNDNILNMNKENLFVASAFSQGTIGGNKAGVYLDGEHLSVREKQELSKTLGYSETVYISNSKVADFKFEYFTPVDEVPLCGHATIATFTVLDHLKKLNKTDYTIETKAAILGIRIKNGTYFMQQNEPKFFEKLNKSDLEDCFDIDAISNELPIQIVSTGLRDIILPIKDEKTLAKMKPNLDEIRRISLYYDTIGIHAFTIDKDRIICRNFAPAQEIDEESATGTSNCALSCYLHNHGIILKNEYKCEQGYSLNSPSMIIVNLTSNGNKIEKVECGGTGYVVNEQF